MAEQNELMKHLIEASRMQSDIDNLKSGQIDMNNRIIGMLGELAGDIKGLRVDLQGVPDKIAACRVEMRREVERDFPDRTDTLEMEKRIEKQIEATDRALSEQITEVNTNLNTKLSALDAKVERLWVKITATVTAVLGVAGFIAWVLQNAKLFGG